MRRNWNKLFDSADNVFTSTELCLMYGISRAYMNELIKSYQIKTLKVLSDILKEKEENNKAKPRIVYISNEEGELFTIKQISTKIGRSVSWVRRAYKYLECDTVKKLLQMKENPPPNIRTNIYSKVIKFDRGKICYRNNFYSTCVHYSSCADARCTGKHHDRYKKDGTCFECNNLLEFTPVPIGGVT